MSKRKYHDYANVEANEPVIEEPAIPEEVIGTVVKCRTLNVRRSPDSSADIVCVIPVGSKVMIDERHSSADWFCVCTEAGLEGYCVSDFISL